ncbi:hypothetical protein EJ02DRAFT_410564 [Clathrospora elynae]|uniref:Uncharacterized protein n=1 Tax=Clathrospora elynae TaxID=706981 RepID=A0A6A5SCN0_9PLEO|nr:hypothetical protein EJ02DRAFT_410564 [Clathrospora elynae]
MADPYHAGLVSGGFLEPSDDEAATEAEGKTLLESQPPVDESSTDSEPPSRAEPPLLQVNKREGGRCDFSESHAPFVDSSKAALTPNSTNPPLLNVVFGHQDPVSLYFTRRYIQIPDCGYLGNSTSNDGQLFGNESADPFAFRLYNIWKQTGKLPQRDGEINFAMLEPNPKHTWQACWPLMNAVIFGHMNRFFDFADTVMDMLQVKVAKGVCADADTISQLFGQEEGGDIPDSLKQFVADRCVDAGIEAFEEMDLSSEPTSFIRLVLETALRRLSTAGKPPHISCCEYHSHATRYNCYENKIARTEDRRMERHEHLREKSRKDFEQVALDYRQNGIKAVDWEERRAEVHQALHKQTGRSWMTPEVDKEATKSSTGILGTTQTNGSVDRVKIEPPTLAPPPPPVSVELRGSTAEDIPQNEIMPAYNEVPVVLVNSATPTITTSNGSNSPHSSVRSTQLAPVPELRVALEMSSKSKNRATCPGAFPESRPGSMRSVTPTQNSSLDGL